MSSGRIEDVMYRNFIIILAALLVAVAPIWNYSRDWTFGPCIAVLFLLGLNLTVYLFAHSGPGDTAIRPPSPNA